MNSQQIILDSRLTHVRELKAEVSRLREENAKLREENEELLHHLSLAILAAEDLKNLGESGRLHVWDGWNLILGSKKEAHDQAELVVSAKRLLEENPSDMVWIVFDGPKENSTVDGRLRISYTGGTGPHRADRLICDFLRMSRFRGDISRITVKTNDKDFSKEVGRLMCKLG